MSENSKKTPPPPYDSKSILRYNYSFFKLEGNSFEQAQNISDEIIPICEGRIQRKEGKYVSAFFVKTK